MRRGLGLVVMLLAFLAGWGAGPCRVLAQPAGRFAVQEQDVDSARRALSNGPAFPWYDAQSDQLRRVHVRPPADTALNRGSKWEVQPRSTASPWWLSGLVDIVLRVLFWILIIGVIALVVCLLVYGFLRREGVRKGESEILDERQLALERNRIESLPFPIQRPRTNLLAEARHHYREGNFREAVIYYYSYLLVELDKHQVIRLTPGKTNRQYLFETRPRPRIAQILELTMVMFEDVFFGDLPLPRERFEKSWSQLDVFQDLVQQVEA